MKIGIFGGTFNPIHIGHLRPVEEVREVFKLEKIFFVLAKNPPHKVNFSEIIPYEERYKILLMAIENNSFFVASDVELRREGKSYTYDTLLFFSERFKNDEIFLIIGKDSFYDLKTWYKWDSLINISNLIVLNRKITQRKYPKESVYAKSLGYKFNGSFYINSSGKKLQFFENSILEISSTKIRENFKKRISNKYLIPDKALNYIISKGFYF